ncbi:MAG: hypothetical protein AB1439_05495 [candidate division FCPU426 bacterium]
MRAISGTASVLAWMLLATACGPASSPQPNTLAYRFADGGRYRVEAECTLERKLEKTHHDRVFSRETSRLDIRASFMLAAVPGPQPGQFQLEFTLLRLRSHDPQGKFRAELGREAGELFWYGETQSLEAYLGPEGWDRYEQLIRKPLAHMAITSLGREASDAGQDGAFNQELVKLLLTNRVLGERIIRSLKIPPVLVAVLPGHPVASGESWAVSGAEKPAASEWEQPVATRFTLLASRRGAAELKLENRLEFSGDDLNALGSMVGLKTLQDVQFKGGRFLITGKVRFLEKPGRPQSGTMRIEKHYSLAKAGEAWGLEEVETYAFTLAPNP